MDLQGLTPVAYNQLFLQKLGQDPGQIAAVGDNFIRDHLREDMVFNSIIPLTPVTPDKLQVSLETETFHEVIHLDPNAAASIVDFRGPGRSQIVRNRRVGLGFHKMETDHFEVFEQELLVYPFPIVQVVHEYGIKALGDTHDLYMLQNAKRAVNFVDTQVAYKAKFGGGTVYGVNDSGVDISTLGPATRVGLNSQQVVRGRQNLSNRIAPATMIVPKYDHDFLDALLVSEMGDVLRSETAISGYRQPTYTGLQMVVTTKAEIFAPGNIWIFADPKFLGKNRVLDYGGNAYKLYIDRRGDLITWWLYVHFGAIIANVGSVVQLRLYNDPYLALNTKLDPLAVTEQDLFQQRSLEETGGVFPRIRQFAWALTLAASSVFAAAAGALGSMVA